MDCIPLVKKGSGRYLAQGRSSGSQPRQALTSPLRLSVSAPGTRRVVSCFGFSVPEFDDDEEDGADLDHDAFYLLVLPPLPWYMLCK